MNAILEQLNVSLAERLDRKMRELGISNHHLAKTIGVSEKAIRLWRSGETTPGGLNLLMLADELNVSPHWLSLGEGPEKEIRVPVIKEAGIEYICDSIRGHNNKVLNAMIERLIRIMDEGDYQKLATVQSLLAVFDPKKEGE